MKYKSLIDLLYLWLYALETKYKILTVFSHFQELKPYKIVVQLDYIVPFN